jgi:dienelactone hydrolase
VLSWLSVDSAGTTLRCALLRPRDHDGDAVVVVPFYDINVTIGRPEAALWRAGDPDLERRAFAWHLARRGVAALAVPWWFEYVLPEHRSGDLNERYASSVALHRATSTSTGLGRAVADLERAIDALLGLPWVRKVAVFGHSLGGKLALLLAALDTRVCAGVAHEPGLGFAHSNWADPWYLDGHVPSDRDLDDLLGTVAPRPFLLVGGGDADGEHNRHLVEAARRHYAALHAPDALEFVVHEAGHTPPPSVLSQCYEWLEHRLTEDGPPSTS